MTKTYKAAIIIPHYNDVARLMTCLDALGPAPDAVELVVVDNDSTDDISPVRRAYPQLRIITETQKGAAMARNAGVTETTAPQLFFLDSDCVPSSDWIETALGIAGQADIIGGLVDVFDETPPPRTGAQAFEAIFAFNNAAYITKKGFSGAGNILTNRDVFIATGPFRTGVSEDLDWCHRARAEGFELIYAPNLKVSHPSRTDWTALARKWKRLTREAFGVNGASPVARLKWAMRAMLMPISVLAHLPKVLRSKRVSGPRDRCVAIGTLIRLRLLRMAWMLRQAAGGSL
ncbi:glycosyltransferase family 2 protein [Profundibacter sp.]